MSANIVCIQARKAVGVSQTLWSAFVDKDRTLVSRIENMRLNAIGPIVAISDFVLRMLARGGSITGADIKAALLAIPDDRRSAWNTYNALVTLCIKHGLTAVLEEATGVTPTFDAHGAEEAADMHAVMKHQAEDMKHQAEDMKRNLKEWMRRATPEARQRIEHAIAAATDAEHWIEMALEAERELNQAEVEPGGDGDG